MTGWLDLEDNADIFPIVSPAPPLAVLSCLCRGNLRAASVLSDENSGKAGRKSKEQLLRVSLWGKSVFANTITLLRMDRLKGAEGYKLFDLAHCSKMPENDETENVYQERKKQWLEFHALSK